MQKLEILSPDKTTPAERECAAKVDKELPKLYKVGKMGESVVLLYFGKNRVSGEVIKKYNEKLTEELIPKIFQDADDYQTKLIKKGDDLMFGPLCSTDSGY